MTETISFLNEVRKRVTENNEITPKDFIALVEIVISHDSQLAEKETPQRRTLGAGEVFNPDHKSTL